MCLRSAKGAPANGPARFFKRISLPNRPIRLELCRELELHPKEVRGSGGGLSVGSEPFSRPGRSPGLEEMGLETMTVVDACERRSPAPKVGGVKKATPVEVEWNNTDPFFDADAAFRGFSCDSGSRG